MSIYEKSCDFSKNHRKIGAMAKMGNSPRRLMRVRLFLSKDLEYSVCDLASPRLTARRRDVDLYWTIRTQFIDGAFCDSRYHHRGQLRGRGYLLRVGDARAAAGWRTDDNVGRATL
jgi:hypothetical protein